jgi:hypothetical protein
MKKESHSPRADGRAGIHLPVASARRLEPDDVRARGAQRRKRRILRRRDHDDLGARPVGQLERSLQRFRVEVHRDDDADGNHQR